MSHSMKKRFGLTVEEYVEQIKRERELPQIKHIDYVNHTVRVIDPDTGKPVVYSTQGTITYSDNTEEPFNLEDIFPQTTQNKK